LISSAPAAGPVERDDVAYELLKREYSWLAGDVTARRGNQEDARLKAIARTADPAA
jgi:hypothetical protein